MDTFQTPCDVFNVAHHSAFLSDIIVCVNVVYLGTQNEINSDHD
jgi:hypothetical protein